MKTQKLENSELTIKSEFYQIEVFYKETGLWRYIVTWSRIFSTGEISRIDGLVQYGKNNVYSLVSQLSKKYGLTYKRKLNNWYNLKEK